MGKNVACIGYTHLQHTACWIVRLISATNCIRNTILKPPSVRTLRTLLLGGPCSPGSSLYKVPHLPRPSTHMHRLPATLLHCPSETGSGAASLHSASLPLCSRLWCCLTPHSQDGQGQYLRLRRYHHLQVDILTLGPLIFLLIQDPDPSPLPRSQDQDPGPRSHVCQTHVQSAVFSTVAPPDPMPSASFDPGVPPRGTRCPSELHT